MKKVRGADYLDHMIEAVRSACAYVEGMSKAAFLADKRTQQAVIYNIAIIGEAVAQLIKDDAALPDRYPDVPWMSMKGMRNRLMHGYFTVDLDLVWETVTTSLPILAARLPEIKSDLLNSESGRDSPE